MKNFILFLFVLLLDVTPVISGPAQAQQTRSNKSFAVELKCPSGERLYEVGDHFSVWVKSINGTINSTTPLRINLQLQRPDGSSIEQRQIINQYCGDSRTGCRLGPFNERGFDWQVQYKEAGYENQYVPPFNSPLNVPGTYRITGSSEGDLVQIKECLFIVNPSRLESLFLQGKINEYALKGKWKAWWTGAFDLYNALYEGSSSAVPLSKKKVSIHLGITKSSEEATNNYDKHPIWFGVYYGHFPEMVVEAGQVILFLNQQANIDGVMVNGFSLSWPSGKYIIQMSGQDYGDSEKQLVREYLKKYPSSLKS
ncbi:hypothetical protein EPO44_13345 [bacterium]|nr:MAG: hypothetical protein EPO44_13345 [bacterium]